MKILKFGGSSVANSENILKVIAILGKASKEHQLAVVVSAFGKTTNALIEGAHLASQKNQQYIASVKKLEELHFEVIKELIPVKQQSSVISYTKQLLNHLETIYEGCYLLQELTPKTLATISSFGELLSSYIITKAAESHIDVDYKDSRELLIASNEYLGATVDFKETNQRLQTFFNDQQHQVTILPGFVASTQQGETTTLGRGGSDYTAAIIAAALEASELQIWTDVSGMFTANPSVVKQAFPIPHISYHEAMELSHFGAKVIYPPTIQPVLKKQIPIVIKNTFKPEEEGTLITKETHQ